MRPPRTSWVIEHAFQATVYDNYGCNDGGAWGAQCWERRGFHHDFERSVIQFDDGELITTDLWNTAFPFIRYRNGDAESWIDGECPCRRRAPCFMISGRAQDLIVTPTRIVSPTTLSQVLLHEGLDDARVVQHARHSIEILLVTNERFTEETFASTKEELLRLLHGTNVQFRLVEGIARSLSGKHRISVNRSGVSPDTWHR